MRFAHGVRPVDPAKAWTLLASAGRDRSGRPGRRRQDGAGAGAGLDRRRAAAGPAGAGRSRCRPRRRKAFAEAPGVRLLTSAEGVLVARAGAGGQAADDAAGDGRGAASVGPHTLVISIAAGISLATLSAGLDTDRVIRAMPNTPAQIGQGVTGAVALEVSARTTARWPMRCSAPPGEVMWFDDEAQARRGDGALGLGAGLCVLYGRGDGGGRRCGRGSIPAQAMLLARQTVIGAAALMEADATPVSVLRENVTSPKGTTAAALGGADGAGRARGADGPGGDGGAAAVGRARPRLRRDDHYDDFDRGRHPGRDGRRGAAVSRGAEAGVHPDDRFRAGDRGQEIVGADHRALHAGDAGRPAGAGGGQLPAAADRAGALGSADARLRGRRRRHRAGGGGARRCRTASR